MHDRFNPRPAQLLMMLVPVLASLHTFIDVATLKTEIQSQNLQHDKPPVQSDPYRCRPSVLDAAQCAVVHSPVTVTFQLGS